MRADQQSRVGFFGRLGCGVPFLATRLPTDCHSGQFASGILKNGSIVKPYTGNMYARETRKAYYLYSETATYIRSRKEDKETIWKTRENK